MDGFTAAFGTLSGWELRSSELAATGDSEIASQATTGRKSTPTRRKSPRAGPAIDHRSLSFGCARSMLRKRLPHPSRLDDGIPAIDGRLSPLALRLPPAAQLSAGKSGGLLGCWAVGLGFWPWTANPTSLRCRLSVQTGRVQKVS